jgi:hypothetical protein
MDLGDHVVILTAERHGVRPAIWRERWTERPANAGDLSVADREPVAGAGGRGCPLAAGTVPNRKEPS